MSIVTRTGDDGETGLVGNRRVSKADPRMHAIGSVDELNALLGVVAAQNLPESLRVQCTRLQHKLFTLGADLAAPDASTQVPRISAVDVREIDEWIATLEDSLPPLASFILPGGSHAGALLHHARTVCRRAERWVVELGQYETVPREIGVFLNRLSDYLFLAAREANRAAGAGEEIVEYGA